MNTKWLITGPFVLMMLFSGQLQAVPSAELKVSGKITYSGCSVIAGNNGVYDYGNVGNYGATDKARILPTLKQTWQVRCDGDTSLAVVPTDNRAATRSVVDPRHFGLGNVVGGQSIGYFLLGLSHASVNGQRAALQARGPASVLPGTEIALVSGERTDWVFPDNRRAQGRVYVMDISVMPVLAADIPVTDKTVLDGSVTLNFIFGL